MKIMIGYDGSSHSEAAINEISRAGVPSFDSEILIVSVADLSAINLPISEFDLHSLVSSRALMVLERAAVYKQIEIEKVTECVSEAAARLRFRFPARKIGCEVLDEKPAFAALLRKAAEWNPDLIIVGSHGRSAIGRFFLGSVSQKVAEGANCAVRVTRGISGNDGGAPPKIIAGAGDLVDAEEVIGAIGKRVWAKDAEIRLIIAAAVSPSYAASRFERSIEKIRASGAQISVEIKSGDTGVILLEEAEMWKADSIFVAAGKAAREKGLGSLATDLLARAGCAIEIVK